MLKLAKNHLARKMKKRLDPRCARLCSSAACIYSAFDSFVRLGFESWEWGWGQITSGKTKHVPNTQLGAVLSLVQPTELDFLVFVMNGAPSVGKVGVLAGSSVSGTGSCKGVTQFVCI